MTASIGGTPGRYNLVRSIANPSLAYGELIIDFTSPDELVENIDEIQEYLTRQYPDAYVKLKRYNLILPSCTVWRTVHDILWRIRQKSA